MLAHLAEEGRRHVTLDDSEQALENCLSLRGGQPQFCGNDSVFAVIIA